VPLVLGLWLALIGYTIAWAGWRNLGISFSPQADGSIRASQSAITLLMAFTGKEPPAPAGAASSTARDFTNPAVAGVTAGANAALQGAAVTGQAVLGATNQLAGGGAGGGPGGLVDVLARGLVQSVDNVRAGARSLRL
jgi:hypothetical protein